MSQGEWQRPEGVTKGGWDYIRSKSIAAGYDQFLEDDPLAQMDAQVVHRWIGLGAPDCSQVIADFGCGTGRTLVPLARQGHQIVGVDLSQEMLGRFVDKAQAIDPPASFTALKANFVQLSCLKDAIFDHAVCLFSSLGMIRGRESRVKFLSEVHRTVRPGGYFIVHAHSSLFQVNSPGGWKWACEGLIGRGEFGDRTADYRGIRDFFIHSYRRRELEAELKQSGFECAEWNEILPAEDGLVSRKAEGKFTSGFRTVGWIVVCRKTEAES